MSRTVFPQPVPRPTVQRSSWAVRIAVWKALLLREGIARLLTTRTSWLWFLLEPLVHTVFMVTMMTVVRVRKVGGIDTAVWLVAGLFGFLLFKRIATQSANAIGQNQPLFLYRQIVPVDFVLVRAVLEAFLLTLVFSVLIVIGELLGIDARPADPLAVIGALFGAWLMALGFGLMASVGSELIPGFRRVIGFIMIPMYFLSGVIVQLSSLPQPYRSWVLLNPVAQALELIRHGFSPMYHAAPEVSLAYLYECALVLLFLGLLLQRRFLDRLKAKPR
ncbi:ABC transporter permease [Derxia lacustris]|uniref:ABC transporter permease n=1 Tax=Derxia lacustris TaxID=764842 RepID=UPI000A177313|nr:ABC transporter permease [Derxia lacustris]